jgi:hypothetical protein
MSAHCLAPINPCACSESLGIGIAHYANLAVKTSKEMGSILSTINAACIDYGQYDACFRSKDLFQQRSIKTSDSPEDSTRLDPLAIHNFSLSESGPGRVEDYTLMLCANMAFRSAPRTTNSLYEIRFGSSDFQNRATPS